MIAEAISFYIPLWPVLIGVAGLAIIVWWFVGPKSK
jgi:hypothetical protein